MPRPRGARRLLEDHGGVEVVGVLPDYQSVLEDTRGLKPDAVLMDTVRSGPLYMGHLSRS